MIWGLRSVLIRKNACAVCWPVMKRRQMYDSLMNKHRLGLGLGLSLWLTLTLTIPSLLSEGIVHCKGITAKMFIILNLHGAKKTSRDLLPSFLVAPSFFCRIRPNAKGLRKHRTFLMCIFLQLRCCGYFNRDSSLCGSLS